MSLLLGIDIGTSAVKASLVDAATGRRVAASTSPAVGVLPLHSSHPGWAEQDPLDWWNAVREAVTACVGSSGGSVGGIGIAYQMHGLVLCTDAFAPVRRSIIWCDSRAVEAGASLGTVVGPEACRERLLNEPGNLTAAKITWVARNEPEVLSQSRWAMLPGDWIAARLTGEAATTSTGLSEMVLWDHQGECPALDVLAHTGAKASILPRLVPMVGNGGVVTQKAADELGLRAGTPVSYRAGDQPNNALSLGVLEPGQCATTAGTSGVVFAVTDGLPFDPHGSVNTFLHVNHSAESQRRGVLMCLNGCGSAFEWLRRVTGRGFGELDEMSRGARAGRGVFLPFGNGSERTLQNSNLGARLSGFDFAAMDQAELARVVTEGTAFAMAHGIELMRGLGVGVNRMSAGEANMFRSETFRGLLATVTGAPIELRDCDGSVGAAVGAGAGTGVWTLAEGAARCSARLGVVEPDVGMKSEVDERYKVWKETLADHLGG